jgi:predicted dehydrogenase
MEVLLLGGGWLAETVYVPFLSEMSCISHVYVCDVDESDVARRYVTWPKVSALGRARILQQRFDAACILTPNYLHAADLEALLGRVDKILIEKPICITPAEISRLTALLATSSTPVYVSAPMRYRDDLVTLRNDYVHACLGEIYAAEFTWLKRKGTPGSAWFTQRALAGGGVLMDMGPHLLDLSYWLFGHAYATARLGHTSSLFFRRGDVYADWHRASTSPLRSCDVEDSAFALLKYPERSLSLKLAWVSQVENDDARLQIFGTKGMLEVSTSLGFSTQTLHSATSIQLSASGTTRNTSLSIGERRQPFSSMLRDFIENSKCGLPIATQALDVVDDILELYRHSGRI